jgi:hypothetical protein
MGKKGDSCGGQEQQRERYDTSATRAVHRVAASLRSGGTPRLARGGPVVVVGDFAHYHGRARPCGGAAGRGRVVAFESETPMKPVGRDPMKPIRRPPTLLLVVAAAAASLLGCASTSVRLNEQSEDSLQADLNDDAQTPEAFVDRLGEPAEWKTEGEGENAHQTAIWKCIGGQTAPSPAVAGISERGAPLGRHLRYLPQGGLRRRGKSVDSQHGRFRWRSFASCD